MQLGIPERGRVAELHVRIFLGRLDHEGVEIAERGGEQQARAVEIDHRLHRLGDGVGLGDVLLLDHGHVGQGLERSGPHGMGLVPAEVALGADIDHADGQRRLRLGTQSAAQQQGGGGSATEEMAAGKVQSGHGSPWLSSAPEPGTMPK